MPDLPLTAAVISGAAIMIPALNKHIPRDLDKKEILCRTGTRLISETERSSLALKLVRSGIHFSPDYFAGVRALILGLYLLFCLGMFVISPGLLLLAVLSPVIYLLPGMWLKTMAERRRMEIKRDMGDFTIMMATALTAGINPVPALQESSMAVGGVLGAEINRFIIEILSGKNFSLAASDLCLRNDVDELVNFVRTLEQIYIQGAPGAETMRIYSEQMRITRKFETMDRAGRLSVQLIFPVMLFILVPILMAIGYPAVYALLHAF